MITIEKLNIYIKYKGDIDMWVRIGKSKEKIAIKTDDWYLIESLLQDLKLLHDETISQEFATVLQKKIIANCENADVFKRLNSVSIYN